MKTQIADCSSTICVMGYLIETKYLFRNSLKSVRHTYLKAQVGNWNTFRNSP